MKLKRISKLKGCGVFRDFAWPNDLAPFKRFNLIYGWNGSGKTTLSRILRALELKEAPPLDLGEVVVELDGVQLRGDRFPQSTAALRVFNRDFLAENVFTAQGTVAPILVLGKENIERREELAKLRSALETAQARLVAAEQAKSAADKALDQFCIARASEIKDSLRSPGQNAYNNYDKADFRRRAEAMATQGDATTCHLADQERSQLMARHQSQPKAKIRPVAYEFPDPQVRIQRASELAGRSVVASVIEALRNDPPLGDWVHHGLRLYRERATANCLFCGQQLPPERIADLDAHFNDEFERLLRDLDSEIEQLEALREEISSLALPNQAELYPDLVGEYAAAETAARGALNSWNQVIKALIEQLGAKKLRPFERIAIEPPQPLPDGAALESLNDILTRHNKTCDEFDDQVKTARERLEADSVARVLEEFTRLVQDAHATAEAVDNEQAGILDLKEQFASVEREIVEHHQPAEELNRDLRAYLGHGELQLEVRESGYMLVRDGNPARGISEGETTAIGLLYFLKSLEDRRFSRASGVVVLDDPVSSLDQRSLYEAFSFIRARTRAALQLLVLTHNFTFFRAMRGWFQNLRGADRRDWCVYMLECSSDADGRSAALRAIDPLLMGFDSEYQYLYSRLHRLATAPPASGLEAYYDAPSVARRVLETFLAFRVPNRSYPRGGSGLWAQMQQIDFDEQRMSRVYRFIQTHSHRTAVGDADEDLTLLAECPAVLQDVIDFIRAGDPEHCSRMIDLVTGNTSASANGE